MTEGTNKPQALVQHVEGFVFKLKAQNASQGEWLKPEEMAFLALAAEMKRREVLEKGESVDRQDPSASESKDTK
ncbi:MAG: hypothetical protein ACM3QZ_10230 [Solirubrobacterales bacterium]